MAEQIRVAFNALAADYDLLRPAEPTVLEALVRRLRSVTGGVLVDIGCGTGRYGIAVAIERSLSLVGLDFAIEPLLCAKARQRNGRWVVADFEAELPIADGSCDAILIAYVVQLVDWARTVERLKRTLREDGTILLLTYRPEKIATMLYHSYIPELREIDSRRYPSVSDLCTLLSGLGMTVTVEDIPVEHEIATSADVEWWLQRAYRKYSSSFLVLEGVIAERRLADMALRLRADIENGPLTFRHVHTLICAS